MGTFVILYRTDCILRVSVTPWRLKWPVNARGPHLGQGRAHPTHLDALLGRRSGAKEEGKVREPMERQH